MLSAIRFVVTYIPLVIAAVQMVENFAQAGTGEEKKKLAMKFIRRVLEKLNFTISSRVETVIGMTIEIAIVALNAFGIFRSSEGEDAEAVAVLDEEAARLHVPVKDDDPNKAEFERLINDLQR